jgi:hypothetical protein
VGIGIVMMMACGRREFLGEFYWCMGVILRDGVRHIKSSIIHLLRHLDHEMCRFVDKTGFAATLILILRYHLTVYSPEPTRKRVLDGNFSVERWGSRSDMSQSPGPTA